MPRYTHLFFDLDHTLWDFDKNSDLAYARLFVSREMDLDLLAFAKAYKPINLRYWKAYREERVSQIDLRRGRLRDTFSAMSLSYDDEVLDAIAAQYIEELPGSNHLFPHTIEVLDYLRSNYTLHCITNGFYGVQHRKLERSGLAPYFQTVTTADDAGCKKPDPRIFQHALDLAGATASKSLMIGDSLEADILGSRDFGMEAWHFDPSGNQADSTTFNDLRTLKKRL